MLWNGHQFLLHSHCQTIRTSSDMEIVLDTSIYLKLQYYDRTYRLPTAVRFRKRVGSLAFSKRETLIYILQEYARFIKYFFLGKCRFSIKLKQNIKEMFSGRNLQQKYEYIQSLKCVGFMLLTCSYDSLRSGH